MGIVGTIGRGMITRRIAADYAFFGVFALLFVASTAATLLWCIDMPAICGMSMPGGWTMSMAWMRMPGQSWPGAALSFLAMWTVMMAAMMLPSLMPMLWRYRQVGGLGVDGTDRDLLTVLVVLGYFTVWAALGLAIFPLGVALAAGAMELPGLARAAPIAAGTVVLLAGLLQFSAWKMRQLACCRMAAPGGASRSHHGGVASAASAWRHGLHLGFHCTSCCAGPTAALLALGVMDLRAMAAVTVAITLERLLPRAARIERVTGAVAVMAGMLMIAQAI